MRVCKISGFGNGGSFQRGNTLFVECENEPEFIVRPAAAEASMEAAQPLLVPHDYRDIKIAENTTVTIDLEELIRQLAERFNPMNQVFNYGA